MQTIAKLLLVGMFEVRDALPEDVKERIENDPRIIYTGFVNGGMEYYYSLMNLYVLPSYREGFPTGVLESQAMELPVLTTRVTVAVMPFVMAGVVFLLPMIRKI